jgi:ferric-dicitrate binding protein FerR (iron transport regulator)
MILCVRKYRGTGYGMATTAAAIAMLSASPGAMAAQVVAGKAVSTSGDVLVRNEDSSAGAPRMRKLKSGDDILKGDVINTSSSATAKLLLTDRSVLDLGGATLFKVDEYDRRNGSDRKVAMTMSYGKVRAAVNTPVGNAGKYSIRTKTATMGVRGTEFIIASDLNFQPAAPASASTASSGSPGSGANTGFTSSGSAAKTHVTTQITVVEGKVDVTDNSTPAKAPVHVKQGEQLTTVADVVGDKTVRKPASVAAEEAPKVVKLDVEQMKTVVQEAKLEDKTFKQAVTIDSSGNSGPSSGIAALSDVGTAFGGSVDLGAPMNVSTPGTFGISPGTIQNALPPGSPLNITVVFKK